MSVLAASDALQVAMVRLRLENVPCRIVTRQEMEENAATRTVLGTQQPRTALGKLVNFQHQRTGSGVVWPFREDRCVVFCRAVLTPFEGTPPTTAVMASMQCGYVLSDGVERPLLDEHGMELSAAAMSTRGMFMTWFSSGGGQ